MPFETAIYKNAFGGAIRAEEPAEFTIIGIPYDLKSTHRKGAAGGPDSIRKASSSQSVNSFTGSGVDLAVDCSIVDVGNLPVHTDTEIMFDTIEQQVVRTVNNGSIPVILGGDHSITYPVVRGMRQVYDEINLVWLDAHPDIYQEYNGDKFSHACPLARILETGGIKSVHQGGIRATTPELNRYLTDADVHVYTIHSVSNMKHLSLAGKTYMTIDIDVLDPAFAPGVGNPVPGGMSTRELIDLVMTFELDIAGFDLVEVNPEYDHASITAAAGAKIIMEIIGKITSSNKTRN
ncbi:agmatinase [candidate division KSB1 bacterium]